jgi:hypothetical protein
MHKNMRITMLIAAIATGISGISLAQTPAPAPAAPPLFATTKVEGTENVYVFRYQNHQANQRSGGAAIQRLGALISASWR